MLSSFVLHSFLFQVGYVGVKHQQPFAGKNGKWVLTEKTNEREGKGERGGDYLSVFSAKLLFNLLMEFSRFSPSSLCGLVIKEGIIVFVG